MENSDFSDDSVTDPTYICGDKPSTFRFAKVGNVTNTRKRKLGLNVPPNL